MLKNTINLSEGKTLAVRLSQAQKQVSDYQNFLKGKTLTSAQQTTLQNYKNTVASLQSPNATEKRADMQLLSNIAKQKITVSILQSQ